METFFLHKSLFLLRISFSSFMEVLPAYPSLPMKTMQKLAMVLFLMKIFWTKKPGTSSLQVFQWNKTCSCFTLSVAWTSSLVSCSSRRCSWVFLLVSALKFTDYWYTILLYNDTLNDIQFYQTMTLWFTLSFGDNDI